MIRSYLLVCVFGLFAQFTFGQALNFTVDNGLPSQRVYSVVTDSKGFLWCATEKGVVMYNGDKFTPFTTENGLPINDIYKIIPTPDGKIWYFGKSAELGYIQNGTIYKYPSADGTLMNPVNFSISGNNVEFYSQYASYILHNEKWIKFRLSSAKRKIGDSIQSIPANLIVNPIRNIIFIYNGKEFIHCDTNFTPRRKFSINEKNWHHRNWFQNGFFGSRLFCLATLSNLYVYDILSGDFKTIEWNNAVDENNNNQAVFTYENQQIGITSAKGRFLLKDDHLELIIPPYELNKNEKVMGFHKDYGDNIWINTSNNGVYKVPKFEMQNTYFKNKNVQRIDFLNGHLYAAVESEGIYTLDSQTQKTNLWYSNPIYCYKLENDNHGQLEILSSMDHFSYDGKTVNSLKYIMHGDLKSLGGKTSLLYKDTLFIATTYDFWVVNNSTHTSLLRLPAPGVYSIERYHDVTFLGTNSGMRILKGNKILDVPALSNKPVKCLKIWNDLLIIGTDGMGVFFYNGKQIFQLTYLQNLVVNGFYIDDKNRLWCSTGFGAHCAELSPVKHNLSIHAIFQSQGIVSNQVNDIKIMGNQLFCATEKGMSILNLNDINYKYKPNIIIKSISLNDSLFNLNNDSLSIISRSNNTISLSYDVGFLAEHKQLRLFYKIDPIHIDWIETDSREISFNGLAPGEYTIYIKVLGLNGNSDLRKIIIVIYPRWYELFWVRTLAIILGIFIFISTVILISIRINRNVRRSYDLKKKIVDVELDALRSKLNPHFIFNTLNSIQFYINNNDLRSSEKYLVLFSNHIRDVFEYSNLKTLSLKEEINLIKDYLALEMMRFEGRITYDIEFDSKIDQNNTFIPSMFLQPFVENAIKHGLLPKKGNGILKIAVKFVSLDTYEVFIIDNGKGYTPNHDVKRKSSTSLIDDRISLLNQSGDWNIQKHIGTPTDQFSVNGTEVRLTIQYLKKQGYAK